LRRAGCGRRMRWTALTSLRRRGQGRVCIRNTRRSARSCTTIWSRTGPRRIRSSPT
jgi:hypothetical protein